MKLLPQTVQIIVPLQYHIEKKAESEEEEDDENFLPPGARAQVEEEDPLRRK